jgi:DNA (cytosine-5)-methyltransferase 1
VRACSCSPSAPDAPDSCWLLPTPTATDHSGGHEQQIGGRRPSGAKRQVDLPTVVALKICLPPLPRGRLLPTPDTGISPNGHGRRGGRPGNGHQSGSSLDAVACTLTRAAGQASVARDDPGFVVRWGEYEPAIRRWEQITGRPAPPPADPGPGGRPVLNPGFSEWLMGLPQGWVCGVPGLSRTVRLRILGNGVVPRQGAAALRLLIGTAAGIPRIPQPSRPGGHHMRAAA